MKSLHSVMAAVAASAFLLAAGCGSSGGGIQIFAADGRAGVPGKLYTVDMATGETTAIGAIKDSDGTEYGVTGMAFGPDGVLYAVTSTARDHGELIIIDPDTAEAVVVGDLTDADDDEHNHYSVADIEFADDGTLYGWSEVLSGDSSDALVSIDTDSGEVTQIGENGECNSYGSGMAFDGSDGTMYLLCRGGVYDEEDPDDDGTLDTVDLDDGTVTTGDYLDGRLSPFVEGCVSYNAAAFVDGMILAVENNCIGEGSRPDNPILVAIDPATAELTEIGALPRGIDALAVR